MEETKFEDIDLTGDLIFLSHVPTEIKKEGNVTKGGIHLLSEVEEKTAFSGVLQWGTVLKIGEEVTKVKVGDSVLLQGHINSATLLGKEIVFLREPQLNIVKRRKD